MDGEERLRVLESDEASELPLPCNPLLHHQFPRNFLENSQTFYISPIIYVPLIFNVPYFLSNASEPVYECKETHKICKKNSAFGTNTNNGHHVHFDLINFKIVLNICKELIIIEPTNVILHKY